MFVLKESSKVKDQGRCTSYFMRLYEHCISNVFMLLSSVTLQTPFHFLN